ncbi:hypothetical protein BOX15_Mlig017077g3, partial [Macrostomum lignano]
RKRAADWLVPLNFDAIKGAENHFSISLLHSCACLTAAENSSFEIAAHRPGRAMPRLLAAFLLLSACAILAANCLPTSPLSGRFQQRQPHQLSRSLAAGDQADWLTLADALRLRQLDRLVGELPGEDAGFDEAQQEKRGFRGSLRFGSNFGKK